ncbi:MAG TPA: FtsX-like permease family protein [Bacteroidales bacterium]|nr:FtsX-like permease family protein [Bacteroidales bacterium]
MNFPFYIARRYLLSKKSHNLINVISAISMTGVGVGALALIVILSVFNGFELVIGKLVNSTTPDLLIETKAGRWIGMKTFPLESLKKIESVQQIVEVIEDDALFRYADKQHIGKIKAVSPNYMDLKILDSLMTEGNALLEANGTYQAVAGAGVAWFLNLRLSDPDLLQVYVPGRGQMSVTNPEKGFNMDIIRLGGVFSSQQDIDNQVIIVPLEFARKLLDLPEKSSSVEVYLNRTDKSEPVRKQIQNAIGPGFTVKDRFEQQETLYNIMRSEKWAIFIILTFVLFMATFNVIGSLTMLVVDKQRDTTILQQLGATQKMIHRLFLFEGLLITLAGGVGGLLLGVIIVWIQQTFGVIRLGDGSGSFIIDAYPVDLQFNDVLLVLTTVIIIGSFSSFVTVQRLLRKIQKRQATD